jgi:hypothetical protein
MIFPRLQFLAACIAALPLLCAQAQAADGEGARIIRCFKYATPGDPDTWEGRPAGEACIFTGKNDPPPITYIAPPLYRREAQANRASKRILCYKLDTPRDRTLGAGYVLNGNCLLTRIDPVD